MKILSLLLICLAALTGNALADEKLDRELIYRVSFGRADDIRLLLSQGADPNSRNDIGWTALSIAADRNDAESFEMVKALAEGGANINIADEERNFPIIVAARQGKSEMLAYLIDKGADFYIKDNAGVTVMDIAKKGGHKEAVKAIQAAIDKDLERLAKLKSPENLKRLTNEYAFGQCAIQYWTYYLDSGQDKNIDKAAVQARITSSSDKANSAAVEIQSLFFFMTSDKLQTLARGARQEIYSALEEMLTNRNRRSQGVGTEADFNKRCQKIADTLDVEIEASAMPKAAPSPAMQ